jgi:hypothetical protein
VKLAILIVAVVAGSAVADPCTGRTPGGAPFPICFDPGNRLSLTAGSDGFGASIALRHEIHFDNEPDLVWRLNHTLLDASYAGYENRFTGTLYRIELIRHARDGHLVIPLGVPKKVFLPFDVGGIAEVGRLRWEPDTPARLGVVKVAGLVDFARAHSFRTRIAIGPSARWDVDLQDTPRAFGEHHVAPFTTAVASLHLESTNGRLVGDVRADAGYLWHSTHGWRPEVTAEASLERTMLAINDRPIALSFGVRYSSETNETVARVGARIVLVQARDPRVSRQVLSQ